MKSRKLCVAQGMVPLLVHSRVRELTLENSRRADHHCSGCHIACDHGSRGHKSPLAHGHTIENDGADTHQATVFQGGAMDNRAMTNRHLSTDSHRLARITMKNGWEVG